MKNIKILISAPSDQQKEVDEVINAIDDFNDIMLKRNITFTPVYWKKNTSTGRAERGQDVINDQVANCDMIVAIVGTRMGTDTGKADSGTAEEVFNFCRVNKFENTNYNTHIFFNTFYDGNVLNLEIEQLAKVQKFQSDVSNLGVLYAPFSNLTTLRKLVTKALDSFYFESKQTELISLQETEIEELGLDDYSDKIVENFQNITSLVTDISGSMREFSQELAEAKKSQPQDTYIKNGIKAIGRLADKITKKSVGAQENLDNAYSNLNSALKIAIEDFLNDENIGEIEKLLIILRDLIKSGNEGQSGLQSFEDAIKAMPRRNKGIIKAKKRILIPVTGLRSGMSDFNNNVELIVHEVERAIAKYKS